MTDLTRWQALCRQLVAEGDMTPVAAEEILRLVEQDIAQNQTPKPLRDRGDDESADYPI